MNKEIVNKAETNVQHFDEKKNVGLRKVSRPNRTLVGTKRGYLGTDTQSDTFIENETSGDGELEIRIDNDGKDVPLPDYVKLQIEFARLKSNKAAGADG